MQTSPCPRFCRIRPRLDLAFLFESACCIADGGMAGLGREVRRRGIRSCDATLGLWPYTAVISSQTAVIEETGLKLDE